MSYWSSPLWSQQVNTVLVELGTVSFCWQAFVLQSPENCFWSAYHSCLYKVVLPLLCLSFLLCSTSISIAPSSYYHGLLSLAQHQRSLRGQCSWWFLSELKCEVFWYQCKAMSWARPLSLKQMEFLRLDLRQPITYDYSRVKSLIGDNCLSHVDVAHASEEELTICQFESTLFYF